MGVRPMPASSAVEERVLAAQPSHQAGRHQVTTSGRFLKNSVEEHLALMNHFW